MLSIWVIVWNIILHWSLLGPVHTTMCVKRTLGATIKTAPHQTAWCCGAMHFVGRNAHACLLDVYGVLLLTINGTCNKSNGGSAFPCVIGVNAFYMCMHTRAHYTYVLLFSSQCCMVIVCSCSQCKYMNKALFNRQSLTKIILFGWHVL